MTEDFLNDPKYKEQQNILDEEMYNYKELDINTNDSSYAFLEWLVNVKYFKAEDLLRVIEKPHRNNELYRTFLRERNK